MTELFCREMAMRKGEVMVVNANSANINSVRPFGGGALVEMVDDKFYYNETGTEEVRVASKNGGQRVSFEAECRRVRVLMDADEFDPVLASLHQQVPSNKYLNAPERRAIRAHLAAVEKLKAEHGEGVKPERQAGAQRSKLEAMEKVLVKNPAAKPKSKKDAAAQGDHKPTHVKRVPTVPPLPDAMLMQGGEASRSAPKMKELFDVAKEFFEDPSADNQTERRNISTTEKLPYISLGSYSDTRSRKPDSIKKKIFDERDPRKEKMWELLCEIAREEDPAFQWTAIGIGPGRSFTAGNFCNVSKLKGEPPRPAGRLWVYCNSTSDERAELDGQEAEEAEYMVEKPDHNSNKPIEYDGMAWQVGSWMPGYMLDTRLRWTTFHGKRMHATEGWESGDRLCCTYFCKPPSGEISAYLKKIGGNPPEAATAEEIEAEMEDEEKKDKKQEAAAKVKAEQAAGNKKK
eukprot:g11060.t1